MRVQTGGRAIATIALLAAAALIALLFWIARGERPVEIASQPGTSPNKSAEAVSEASLKRVREEYKSVAPASEPNAVSTQPAAVNGVSSHSKKVPLDIALLGDHEISVRFAGPDGRPLGDWCRANLAPGNETQIDVIQTRMRPAKRLPRGTVSLLGNVYESQYRRGEWPTEIKLSLSPPFPSFVSACYAPEPRDAEHVAVIATERVDVGSASVQFTIPLEVFIPPKSNVHFCAVDALSGAPIVEAHVGLNPLGTFGPENKVTGLDGCVQIDDLRRGMYFLMILAPAHERIQEEVILGPDANLDLGTYRLSPSTKLTGRVLSERGPLGGIDVAAYPFEQIEKAHGIHTLFMSKTEADGSFEIHDLGRRRYVVRAQGFDWAPTMSTVDTTAGDVSNLVLNVTRGVKVTLNIDEELSDGTLYIANAENLPAAEGELEHLFGEELRLSPGQYEWRIDVDGKTIKRQKLDVGNKDLDVHITH